MALQKMLLISKPKINAKHAFDEIRQTMLTPRGTKRENPEE